MSIRSPLISNDTDQRPATCGVCRDSGCTFCIGNTIAINPDFVLGSAEEDYRRAGWRLAVRADLILRHPDASFEMAANAMEARDRLLDKHGTPSEEFVKASRAEQASSVGDRISAIKRFAYLDSNWDGTGPRPSEIAALVEVMRPCFEELAS